MIFKKWIVEMIRMISMYLGLVGLVWRAEIATHSHNTVISNLDVVDVND